MLTGEASGRVCSVCDAPIPPLAKIPPGEMAPDLDGRPGEPARSTLPQWVAVCRKCGTAAPDLADVPECARKIVATDDYRAQKSRFVRWAMIAEVAGEVQAAAEAMLQAAWVADDAGEDASALRCRAAALWQGDPLRRLDILRRAGAFETAQAFARSLDAREEAAGIVAFQVARIAAQDTSRHSISSVLRPPLRTPHAAHGRASVGSGQTLFRRLFGG